MIMYNVLNSVGTISYFFPTLMTSLGYKGRRAQCECTDLNGLMIMRLTSSF